MSYTPTITKSPLIWEGDTAEAVNQNFYLDIGNGFNLIIGSGFKLIIQPGRAGNNWTTVTKDPAIF